MAREPDLDMPTPPGGQHRLPGVPEEIAAHPRFAAAVHQYTLGVTDFRQGPRLLNKLVSHNDRFRVIGYLIYLHCHHERYGHYGATYSNLLALCVAHRHASPRAVKTVLAMLQLGGFISVVRDPDDRRSKVYRPTEKMWGFSDKWLTYGFGALDALDPEGRRVEALHADPEYARYFYVTACQEFQAGEQLTDRVPEFAHFFAHEGGFPVLAAIMLADGEGGPVPSRAAIAERFGSTKTQVGNLLTVAADQGLVTLDAVGTATPTGRMRDLYARWVAIELAYYARNTRPGVGGDATPTRSE